MSDQAVIDAAPREARGKGGARALRRGGRTPAIVYGGGGEPLCISLDHTMLERELNRRGFFARLYDLKLGDDTIRVLPRDVQVDPVSDAPLHIDFIRYVAGATMAVSVEVIFEGQEESEGLKRGAVLNYRPPRRRAPVPARSDPRAYLVARRGGTRDRRQHPYQRHRPARRRLAHHRRSGLHHRHHRRAHGRRRGGRGGGRRRGRRGGGRRRGSGRGATRRRQAKARSPRTALFRRRRATPVGAPTRLLVGLGNPGADGVPASPQCRVPGDRRIGGGPWPRRVQAAHALSWRDRRGARRPAPRCWRSSRRPT